MISYENFDLRIQADGERFLVSAATEEQQTSGEPFELDWSMPWDLGRLSSLGPEALRERGSALFDALIRGRVRFLYHHARGRIGGDPNKGVRIRILLNSHDERLRRIIRLPWEILFDRFADAGHLPALDSRRPIVRTIDSIEQAVRPTSGRLERILLALANPDGWDDLDLDRECAGVEAALGRIEIRPAIERHMTRNRLLELISNDQPQVVHFMGHGDMVNGKGVLVLEDENGNEDPLDASTFAMFFAGRSVPQLVILTACLSAEPGPDPASGPFAGVAAALVAAGIPAVIAMQATVRDESAIQFTERLYQRIVRGDPIEAAVSEARKALHADRAGTLDWAFPVLFVRRQGGGVLVAEVDDQTSPEKSIEATRRSYLRWVMRTHEELSLVGLTQGTSLLVPLQEVYVALRGDRISAQELLQSKRLLDEQVEELNESARELGELERRELRARVLRDSPHMMSLRDRDRSARVGAGVFQSHAPSSVTLADAFGHERWLVILGDPGSGKTTLARWLALGLARALEQGRRFIVPANHVNPETPYDRRDIDLGPARLPILVHVSEFAEELERSRNAGNGLTLVDWLAAATWKGMPPSDGGAIPLLQLDQLFRTSLRDKNAVVILDGLDEIAEKTSRSTVVEAVRDFCRDFFTGPRGNPSESGGNQLVVTSRIAGYHSAPLAMQGVTTVVIEPMRRGAVEHFCSTWMHAVQRRLLGETAAAAETAKAAAAGLISAIFARASLAEIATNPLLITNVASLYLTDPQTLPATRAELYQKLIEMLIRGSRQTGLDPEEVLYVLAPVAAEIHQKHPTGLIDRREIEPLVTEYLARARGRRRDRSLVEDVRRFLDGVSEQVGLLASRGEQLFGFLHLTFQEYLAGCDLVSDQETAAEAILAKLTDPRWREPILLAIGYAGSQWSAAQSRRLLDELLVADEPLGDFLPRVALLLAEAVTELPRFHETSFRRLVLRLLRSYAAKSTRRFPQLEARIERALLKLRHFGDADLMDEVFAEAIAAPDDPGLAPAAARLVLQNVWLAPPVVDALHASLERDSAALGWPIERALCEAVSPQSADVTPVLEAIDEPVRQALARQQELETGELLARLTSEVPRLQADAGAHASELEELRLRFGGAEGNDHPDERKRWKLLEDEAKSCAAAVETLADLHAGGVHTRAELSKAVDDARAKLNQLLFARPRDYERLLSRHAIASAALEEFHLRTGTQIRASPSAPFPVRAAVEQGFASGRYDYRQLAALAAVYGGYPDLRADEASSEYYELATFLQRSDAERQMLLDSSARHLVARFGNGDVVYRIAIYLDEGMNGRSQLGKQPAVFSPTAIHRESPLDRVLLQCLRRRLPADEWIPPLWRAWKEEPSLRGRADAIAALVALGEDVVPELRAALADPGRRPAVETALENLARLEEFLRDAVYRAAPALLQDLHELHEAEPYQWVDVTDALLVELARSSNAPIDFTVLRDAAPEFYRPVLEADRWCRVFSAADDRVYYTATVLDSVPKADELVKIFANVGRSPSLRGGRLLFRWPVEPIPPKLADDPGDIPIEVLQAIEILHLENLHPDFLYAMEDIARNRFQPRVTRNPELAAVLTAFLLRTAMFRAARVFPVIEATDPTSRLLESFDPAADPYFRVRVMADLLPFFPRAHVPKLMSECVRAATKVRDAFRRSRSFELLLPLAGENDREDILDGAESAARKIDDPEQRARSQARLARWRQGRVSHARWIDAIRSAAAVREPYFKAETLRTIMPHLPASETVYAAWQQTCAGLPSDEARASANGRRATMLLRRPPHWLREKLAVHADAWAPVLFSAAARETLAQFRPAEATRDLWLALAAQPERQDLVASLQALETDDGIPLTIEAARAIDALAAARQSEPLRTLLPLLQSPVPEARRLIDRWLARTDDLLAAHAGLLIAENGRRIDATTLPHLVELLERGPDRSRCRAELVLLSRIWSAKKEAPCLKVSDLGVPLCDAIAHLYEDFLGRDTRVARIFRTITGDYVHDDPAILEHWIARVRASGEADWSACANLRSVLRLTPETWPLFLTALVKEPQHVRLLLLEALTQMLHLKSRVSKDQLPAVVDALRNVPAEEFEGIPVLIEPELAVAQASIAIAGQGTRRAGLAALAEEELRRGMTTLGNVLRLAGDDALVGQLAAIGRTNFRILDGSEPEAQVAAATIVANDRAFPALVDWLTVRLANDRQPSFWFPATLALLTVTARAVRLLPATYLQHVDRRRLEPLLTREAQVRPETNGRRAAIVLLGHLDQVSKPAVNALLFALGDDRDVQDAAVEAIEHLTFRDDIRASLVGALGSGSTRVAAGAARMLSVIASHERTSNEVRNEILHSLIDAVGRKPSRGIYQLTGSGSNAVEAVSITRLGSLDQEIYRAVLQVAGLAESAR